MDQATLYSDLVCSLNKNVSKVSPEYLMCKWKEDSDGMSNVTIDSDLMCFLNKNVTTDNPEYLTCKWKEENYNGMTILYTYLSVFGVFSIIMILVFGISRYTADCEAKKPVFHSADSDTENSEVSMFYNQTTLQK